MNFQFYNTVFKKLHGKSVQINQIYLFAGALQ